jgi:hypothetical protein
MKGGKFLERIKVKKEGEVGCGWMQLVHENHVLCEHCFRQIPNAQGATMKLLSHNLTMHTKCSPFRMPF